MINKPVKVPPKKIDSIDIDKFGEGWFLGGAEIAPKGALTDAKDVEIDRQGHITPRRRLSKFLPDTVGVSYQKMPVTWGGTLYYFTADDGKIKFCEATDASWSDCSGSNSFTTNNGGMTKFLRVLDKLLILNGKNGDKLAYVDLATAGFPIVKYTAVANPVATPSTSVNSSITGTSYNIYYAYSYSGPAGETELSPIKTQAIGQSREMWPTLSTPGVLTLTRGETAPTGATYWNVYIAISASGGSIQASNMLLLMPKLDISKDTFIDDGTLAINLSSIPPLANSTDGPRVEQGIAFEGNPILFADQDNPYAIWIGGGGIYALDFSISNGGYTAEPEKGSNFYPSSIVGFRTGTGTAALTILYSNTEGLSKQAILAQSTVTYGGASFSVWGITEQHYGAAGVAAPNSAVNYNGAMNFLSTDGFVSLDTEASKINVLSLTNISTQIESYIESIKVSAMDKVIGTAWSQKFMWLIPSYGFDTPQQILVFDTKNAGVEGKGAWYTLDIAANWIGTVSPPTSEAFVYICVGRQTYRLQDLLTTADFVNGELSPFSTRAVGALISGGGDAHNTWQAAVQAVFYLINVIGNVTVGVNYKNQSKVLKTKSKLYSGPVATPSISGGWGDTQWTYANFLQIPGWGSFPVIDTSSISVNPVSVRIPVRIDDITNELQWFITTDSGYNNYKLKSVSFEGVALGVRPDLQ